MQENILVCVSYGENAEKLMKRAKRFSDAFQGGCIALNILEEEIDELNYEQEENRQELIRISNHLGIKFIQVAAAKGKIAEIMARVIKDEKVTQLMIGQPARTKWEIVTKGSIINDLFQLVDGVDIHLVEINREVYIKEEKYQRGVKATLIKNNGEYQLSLSNEESATIKGVYFQSTDTEFLNGIFKIEKDGFYILKVSDGKIDQQELKKINN